MPSNESIHVRMDFPNAPEAKIGDAAVTFPPGFLDACEHQPHPHSGGTQVYAAAQYTLTAKPRWDGQPPRAAFSEGDELRLVHLLSASSPGPSHTPILKKYFPRKPYIQAGKFGALGPIQAGM